MPLLGSGIPLVGRAAELRALTGELARATAGEARAVLLAGDAGVGKTRLTTELGRVAAQQGALVLHGRCLDVREGGLPYLPFAESIGALAGLAASDERVAGAVRARPALGRLLPNMADPPGEEQLRDYAAPADQDQRRSRPAEDFGQLQLYDAVLGVLTEVAEGRPVALVLEDLHWADASTRNLLSFLLSRLRSQRLLVLGTYREEDVYRRHPLRALLAELVRLPAVERLELPPLADADARAFVTAVAEQPLPPEVVAAVAQRSEGNPFFAEELLASGAASSDVPAALADVLLARIEQLSAGARRVLRAVAVASDAVTHDALSDVSGLDEAELDDALREAVQHHVLVVKDRCHEFRHALLREAVYADLLPGERSRMHAAYAARIATQPPSRGQDARLAHHSLRSNDLPTALSALVRAASEAEKLHAPGAALRHTEQALEIWDAVPREARPDGYGEVTLLHNASHFAGTSGEPERAIAFARSAVATLSADTQPAAAAMKWRRLAEALLAQDRTYDEAVLAINQAWELVKDSEPSSRRAWVLATRARILRGEETSQDTATWCAEAAIADARAAGVGGAEASALTTLGALADSGGDPAEARRLLREAVRKAQAAGSIITELTAMYFLALSFHDHGELDDAGRLYRDAVRRAEETGLRWSNVGIQVRYQQLSADFARGAWPDDVVEWPATGSGNVSRFMSAAWVDLAVARGHFEEADGLVEDLRQHWADDIWMAIAATCAGTQSAYWQGKYPAAVARASEGIDWFTEQYPWVLAGLRAGALGVEAAAAWAGEARLRGGGDGADGAAAVEQGQRLLAAVRDCLTRAKPRSGTLGPEGQAWLLRAEAAASGLRGPADAAQWAKVVAAFGYGARYEQAVSRRHYAEALLAAGDTSPAAEELRQAHEFAVSVGAVPLRDSVRDLARRARIELDGVAPRRDSADLLTDRERAVLELVAKGRTNRQVGEELYISEKTVSVHLSRAMAKLGATRRAEAVKLAYDRGVL